MSVAIFVHDPEGDMGDAIIIGPFIDWDAAEKFRDKNYPWDGTLEGVICSMVGQRDKKRQPKSEKGRFS